MVVCGGGIVGGWVCGSGGGLLKERWSLRV